MPRPLDIPSLTSGQQIEDTFLVLEIEPRKVQVSGDPFTILTLGNSTGNIGTEPFWSDRQDQIAGIHAGQAVQVIGQVGEYKQRKQLQVTSIRVVPQNAVDLAALLPSVGPVDRYWETLDGWRREIAKPRLKAVVDLFYDDDDFRAQYEACPAAVRGHHAALGGLLKHTTEVAAIARTIARVSGADGDLVLAGALLHDVGKLESYRWDGIFAHTDEGRLVGHVVLGALMLDQRLGETETPVCTETERHLLLHLILSHHGQLQFGSPIAPMTLEAEILHWADNASAKTASMVAVLHDGSNFPEGLVSTSQWMLDRRRVYRGTSDWGADTEPNGGA
ncbi:MAG: HD domain-containing protein [Gemmatimonadales bacterium]|jgi:3'-5' exoribonuclease